MVIMVNELSMMLVILPLSFLPIPIAFVVYSPTISLVVMDFTLEPISIVVIGYELAIHFTIPELPFILCSTVKGENSKAILFAIFE